MQRCNVHHHIWGIEPSLYWKLNYFDTTESIALSNNTNYLKFLQGNVKKQKQAMHILTVLWVFISLSLPTQCTKCLVLCEPLKDFKVVGKCLPGATRILDGYWNIPTSSKRECHGHSVVIICVYSCDIQFLRWSNHTVIRTFFNCCS